MTIIVALNRRASLDSSHAEYIPGCLAKASLQREDDNVYISHCASGITYRLDRTDPADTGFTSNRQSNQNNIPGVLKPLPDK
jgi:hypothetical protein